MLLDYNYSQEKREIQKRVFPLVKPRSIITLAGPNLVTYLNMYPDRVREVEIWENNPQVMLHQLANLKHIKGRSLKYKYGDIINAKVDRHSFYDLDFCGTVRTAQPHLKRFKNCPFSATFSMRFCSLKHTLGIFLDSVGERAIRNIPHPQSNLLKTNKNEYLYTVYKGNCPMLFVFKFH